MMKNKNVYFLLLLIGLALAGALMSGYFPWQGAELPVVSFRGRTMGTTYHVQIAGADVDAWSVERLQAAVDAELLAVNEAMSTYMPESEISQFNRLEAGVWMPIGDRFREVFGRSAQLNRLTEGAFDPTLGPLIDLWGFGAKPIGTDFPTPDQIDQALSETGFQHLELTEKGLRKHREGVEVNVSAIAKGYGVDRVAEFLESEGFENLYVEIGGELVCTGVNGGGVPWRIGIQIPSPGAGESALQVVGLDNAALATSGDYRNYSVSDEGFRHHILDPRTGRPATHTLASVSVITDDCMNADAIATALFVMGTGDGYEWVKAQEGVEALFIDREGEGYSITATEGFEETLIAVP